MNTWGFTNSFGAFQTYFTDALHRSPSTIAWIGSTQTFLLFFLGTITGRLTDAGHFRKVFFVGSLATVVGIFASSFCHRFEEHFVTLGIAVGVGNGCLFCPMLTVMSSYFDKRRAMAIGVAACGSASGGLVYSAMARQLLPSIGYPWTMRAITLIQFALLAVANLYLRPRMPKKKRSELIDWSAFRNTSYNFYAAASFFVSEPLVHKTAIVLESQWATLMYLGFPRALLTVISLCLAYTSRFSFLLLILVPL